MSEAYRPDLTRRLLHWLDGERWCATCRDWAPFGHDADHPPLPGGKPRRRQSDSDRGSPRRPRRRGRR